MNAGGLQAGIPRADRDAATLSSWILLGGFFFVTGIAAPGIAFGSVGTAAHADNANISPGIPASTAEGNLLVMFAAIRNPAAAVTTPLGWTRLLDFHESNSHAAVFGKVAGSSESAPTVSFTGGSAGDTTSAQIARFTGVFHNPAKCVVTATRQSNASAQDIAFPGLPVQRDNCLVLYLGWKQDDWTSVATIGGATEIGEPSTITGNDQGLVWDYLIQTTGATVIGGSFVVTGGASAISDGAVLVLAEDARTFTVTRSVNGVVKSHPAGTPVKLWQPAVVAL